MTRPCPTTHPSKYATTTSGDHSNKANNPAPGGSFACAGPFGYEIIEHMFDSAADRDMATLATTDLDIEALYLTDPLPPAVARAVEAAVLPDAARQNTSELARAARKAIARLDPDGAHARHQNRRADRRVVLYPMDDAMAELRAYLPAADATRVYRKVDQVAHAAAGPGDGRTMDQRRADTLTDLILNPTANTTNTTGGGGS